MVHVLFIFVILLRVKFLTANACFELTSAPIKEAICPKKELTDWLDTQLEIKRGGTGLGDAKELVANENYDSFDFIELIAFPVNHTNLIETRMCVSFSALDLFSSDNIQFQFSLKDDGKSTLKYRFDYFLYPKNPERILTVLRDPPNLRLACFPISGLYESEKNPTIIFKVKSKKVDSRRLDNYSQFYFKIPTWINAANDCKSEPFVYVNTTYRHFEKVIITWNNCSSKFDVTVAKYDDKTDKQKWAEQIMDVDMSTPLVFWQIKDNSSTYHYKAKIIAHLENDIPR